jgi:adenosylmethionine-8-amino-7-oxononanoate aminotransferase
MGRLWHPFTQHGSAGPMVNIARADGAVLYTKDGREIIDAISSWWVNTHGHCHPKIVAAVKKQSEALEQVIFAGFTHDAAEELAEKLLGFVNYSTPSPLIPLPKGRGSFDHIFLSDSGSTSVEVALKMAIGYHAHINQPRKKIVAMEHAYHGDTFGAMAAGERSIFSAAYAEYLFDVLRIPFPEAGQENETVTAFEKLLRENKGDIAALIIEPLVLGAAGMKMYRPEVLNGLAALCRRHGVLLIYDEVMTGFGRTGTKFAFNQTDHAPDILCLSKGITGGFLPMGATLCRAEIYDAFYSKDRAKMFFHSSSYTGNALACAAAVANLEIWESEPVLNRIENITAQHEQAKARFETRKNAIDIRVQGTILAFEFLPPSPVPAGLPLPNGERVGVRGPHNESTTYLSPLAPRLYDFFLSNGVLLRPIGETVYILPPYCITERELRKVYDTIERALDQFAG